MAIYFLEKQTQGSSVNASKERRKTREKERKLTLSNFSYINIQKKLQNLSKEQKKYKKEKSGTNLDGARS